MDSELIDQLWDSFQFLGADKEAFENIINTVYVEAKLPSLTTSTFNENMQLYPDY